MQLYGPGVSMRRERSAHAVPGKLGMNLRGVAAIMLGLLTGMPAAFAQQGKPVPPKSSAASALPAEPQPIATEPLSLRDTARDYSRPAGDIFRNPQKMYMPTHVPPASFVNSVRLDDLVKDGKIYLSLSDALALTIENNYDIAIARYNLDIADTDILRARSGAPGLLGAPSGLVTGTLGGSTSTLSTGGGPGGTTVGSGGAGSGSSGLSLTTSGAGPAPEVLDPTLTGSIVFDRNHSQLTSIFSPAAATNTNTYNFTFDKGFVPGTALAVAWNNNRVVSSSPLTSYFPNYNSAFKATLTQHLLQGFGIFINKRFMYQAENDRRITDSAFRQQIMYTVNQVEEIYWGLVSAYENVQSKERALSQSTELLGETQKELQIGTMAPLDVVNAQQTVATDRQSLVSAQNDLKYQQMIMKQAIARNLNDPALESADIIPTDRVNVQELPEESQPVDDLVKVAFQQRPELEQAVLTLRNDEITLKGAKNALLPTLDAYAYYGASITGGPLNPNCNFFGQPCFPAGSVSPVPGGYGGVLSDLVNSTAPDKGVGFNLNINLRNREAQAQQARSLMEYRQAELRLEQLYTEIRMQVVNAQFALANDRALVLASRAALQYAQQSLDAEQKKLHLGASTTANVLLQEKNLANAEYNMIHAETSYASHRASLYQIMATTLQHYGINLNDAASGNVSSAPTIPGIKPSNDNSVAPTTPPPAH